MKKQDIRMDGIHSKQSLLIKMGFSLQNYISSVGWQLSGNRIYETKKEAIDNVISNWSRSGQMG